MDIWTAFVIGLAGSLHCAGMCGPIAIMLPVPTASGWRLITGRVLYNLGRVITYSVFGFVFGFVGQEIFIGGYQRILSITLGVLILLALIIPGRYISKLTGSGIQGWLTRKLKNLWHYLMQRKLMRSMLMIGVLNGFLPCGLVYIAIAGSISTGSPTGGALYMALFGLGTIPVMLSISMVGKLIGAPVRTKLRRMLPVSAAMLAVLFILRGMSLGIPYISPQIEKGDNGATTVTGCHDAAVAPEPSGD